MKLKNLNLKTFRHFTNTNIEFGKRLTVISGQNGTGKSSILGWIAQLCDFKGINTRLNDKPFREDYKNVFRFCPTNDYPKNYEVLFTYQDQNGFKLTKTIKTRLQAKTDKSPQRYRTDIDGRGNTLEYPIIYLGLKRLIPLATEKKIKIKNSNIDKKFLAPFSRLSKEILILVDDDISPESVESSNKDILAMKTANYGHLGNSAGQDNLGQIISSLLSYEKLKTEKGDDYEGGIILIDEIDASLYAGSQIKLVDKLHRYAERLNLQIIFTTHSLEIIEHLESKLGDDTKINHLVIKDGSIENIINPSFIYISNKIKNQVKKIDQIKKKKLICEDKIAEYWTKNLLNGSDLKQMFQVEKGPFPDGTLVSMAESKHSLFHEVGFILDGDVKKKFKTKKIPGKTVFLPEEYRPETIMYEYVKKLSDNDEFWDDAKNFTKQTCFANYQDSGKGTHKRWFIDDDNIRFFGRSYSKLFNRWKQSNPKKVKDFQSEIRKVL